MSTIKKQKISNAICDRLWRVRRETGLTDQELVWVSSKSHAWWHRQKYSQNVPHASSIEDIALRLGISTDWVMTGAGPEPDWAAMRENLKRMLAARPRAARKRGLGEDPASTMVVMETPGVGALYVGDKFFPCVCEIARRIDVTRSAVLEAVDTLKERRQRGEIPGNPENKKEGE